MVDDVRAQSAWRPDDIVAYEEMRDLAVQVQALLIARARREETPGEDPRDEARSVRLATVAVDGFDRKAVDAQMRQLAVRLVELRSVEREHG